jgi:TRAP-type C4-dicarboxylate transport system permease small subunit
MLLIVVSVGGGLFRAPILGDTEIVDLLIAVTVFCFLPYCHLRGGNVVVDFFARPLPQVARDWLDVMANVALAAVAGFLTWRLIAGGFSAYSRDQRGMFLQLPEWPVYAIGSAACLLWIAVIVVVAWECALRALGKLPALTSPVDKTV